MTDLFPGMMIEVSTVYAVMTHVADRPAWLSEDAQWPPGPGGVMYMIEGTSFGICDRCILTCGDEIEKTRGQKMVVERGASRWYCSCHLSSGSLRQNCKRWWDGHGYATR